MNPMIRSGDLSVSGLEKSIRLDRSEVSGSCQIVKGTHKEAGGYYKP